MTEAIYGFCECYIVGGACKRLEASALSVGVGGHGRWKGGGGGYLWQMQDNRQK